MRKLVLKSLAVCLLLASAQPWAAAQEIDFRAPADVNDAAVSAVMRDLAQRMLPVYQDSNPDRFLSNLGAIQTVAGDYRTAYATRQSLIERRRGSAGRPPGRAGVYDLYARARSLEVEAGISFPQAFTLAFRGAVPRLQDRDAYVLIGWLSNPVAQLREEWQRTYDRRRSQSRISLAEAVDLIWAYYAFEAYRRIAPLAATLDAEESRRRYVTENVRIRTADGASIAAVVVRPKVLDKLPALLEFSIDEAQNDGKEAASHGYVGVMAYARGTHGTPGTATPFMFEGEDTRAAIVWIAKQSWSNGAVGMYGGGYSGYAAFAAARRAPSALKAIATSDPIAPGIDFPMAGGIYRNAAYRWAYTIAGPQGAEAKIFADEGRWSAFNRAWYAGGKSYWDFASVPGPHTALFNRWLGHPSYDQFWRKMLPDRQQFARIAIPVLTMTGYYSGGASGALHYFTEHHRANKRANHTLLIGPYDERATQYGPSASLRGYQLDQAALIDLRELRFQWFDHVLKEGQQPALLKDRVNYQVMGKNEWRSAASLREPDTGSLKLFLEPDPSAGDRNQLVHARGAKTAFIPQTFDLADRDDANKSVAGAIVRRNLPMRNGDIFVSEPLPAPVRIGGALSGQLDFTVNKMDMDVSIALYELLPSGEYIALFEPSYDFRASYARNRSSRNLLKAGMRQVLPFRSDRVTYRELRAGSRIAIVLGISKRPDRQVNYGTGYDVSDESIGDGAVPLRIRWYNSSFVELPVHGQHPPP